MSGPMIDLEKGWTMNNQDLATLLAELDAAVAQMTPWPWVAKYTDLAARMTNQANGEGIVALANAYPRLREAIEQLQREKATDAWHTGWQVAVRERDEARRECDEARARAIRWNNEHAAAEDRWVEERDALRAEVLQLRKNLLRTWAAAEVREYDLRKLVAQQREALSTALNRAEQLFASDRPPPRSCGHCGTPSASCDGDCADAAYISQDLWKARAVLAAEVPS